MKRKFIEVIYKEYFEKTDKGIEYVVVFKRIYL